MPPSEAGVFAPVDETTPRPEVEQAEETGNNLAVDANGAADQTTTPETAAELNSAVYADGVESGQKQFPTVMLEGGAGEDHRQLLDSEIFGESTRAVDVLGYGTWRPDAMLGLESTHTNLSPADQSIATKYGVKFDEEQQPDGTEVRKYYVAGADGNKLPVLDINSENPIEVERRLKEWRDTKATEVEKKYNVEFSEDGQKDTPRKKKEVDLRAPRIDELLALEDGLRRSESSAVPVNNKPVLVQFAVQPTSDWLAYKLPKGDQQRILFEPVARTFEKLRETVLHEWGHMAEDSLSKRNAVSLELFYTEMGYRQVKAKDENGKEYGQWQMEGKDGDYYTQGPGQHPFGNWTRVDDQGRPLKKDGTVAVGWDDKEVDKRSNYNMMSHAAVRPATDYFDTPWEGGAEALSFFRGDAERRANLYMKSPELYEATKQFDQADLDNDPRFGRNADNTSKYIRLPDGTIGLNNYLNQQAVLGAEAELARKKSNP